MFAAASTIVRDRELISWCSMHSWRLQSTEGMCVLKARGCSSPGNEENSVGRVALVAWMMLIARSHDSDPIICIHSVPHPGLVRCTQRGQETVQGEWLCREHHP